MSERDQNCQVGDADFIEEEVTGDIIEDLVDDNITACDTVNYLLGKGGLKEVSKDIQPLRPNLSQTPNVTCGKSILKKLNDERSEETGDKEMFPNILTNVTFDRMDYILISLFLLMFFLRDYLLISLMGCCNQL